MAPVSACRPAMSGSVPATPAGAAAPAASAPAAASLGSSVSVLATYHHHHTTQQQQKKNQIKTPNGGPGPILPRAHGGERSGPLPASPAAPPPRPRPPLPPPGPWAPATNSFPPPPPVAPPGAWPRRSASCQPCRNDEAREKGMRRGETKRREAEKKTKPKDSYLDYLLALRDRRRNKIRPPP
jgi:hypothetical protein